MIIEERAISTPHMYALEKSNNVDVNEGEFMGPFVPTYVRFVNSRASLLSEKLKEATKDLINENSPENWQHYQRLNSVITGFLSSNPWLQWHDPHQEDQ